ncbi:MAG: branched-chain amino acid transport system substrate-binding protein [Myxococcota bacterium]|jgi:branched-chain amino acid transport system substrate-binding protein
MLAVGLLSGGATLGGCSLGLDFDDECENTAACVATDSTLRCIDGFCEPAPLVEPGGTCNRIIGSDPRVATDTILLGSVLPRTGALGPFGGAMENAIELAIAEINEAGGVNGRKFGVLTCDSGSNVEIAVASAEHLTRIARVKAVIGAASSSTTINVFNDVIKDAGVLLISPASTSPAITDLPDNGLLWRTAPSDAIQGQAIAGYLQEKGYQRVTVVYRDDAYGLGLSGAIRDAYCNGTCPSTFTSTLYGAQADTQETLSLQLSQQQAIAESFIAVTPDAVVLISFPTDGAQFLNRFQNAPFDVIVSDGMKDPSLLGQGAAGFVVGDPEIFDKKVACRIVGTNPASPSGAEFDEFRNKYRARFSNEEPRTFSANAFDAAYVVGLAYAGGIGAGGVTDGRTIADGLARLSAGIEVTLGFDDWNTAVGVLAANGESTVDITGISGPLDFDPVIGEGSSGTEAWRFDLGLVTTDDLGVVLDAQGMYKPGIVSERETSDPCLSL